MKGVGGIVWMGAAVALSATACGEERQAGEPFAPDSSVLELDPSWPATETPDLGDLLDVDVRPDGTIVLLERFGAEVLVLNGAGQELVRFGGPGDGPGEFNPQGLNVLVTTDSSILVPDLFQQRMSEFSYAGELMGTSRFPGEGSYAVDWRQHPHGGLVFRLLERTGDRLMLWRGEQLDTLHVFPATASEPNQLLAPVSLWDIHSDGLVVATSDEWSVRFMEFDSDEPQWIARRPGGAAPLSDDDRGLLEELLVNSAARQTGGAAPTGEARAQLLAQVSFPSTLPSLAGLRFGDGDVWVREAARVEDMGQEAMRVGSAAGYGGPWWTVLTHEGTVKSRPRLPDNFTVTRITEGWLYGIHADELGVERPARIAAPSVPEDVFVTAAETVIDFLRGDAEFDAISVSDTVTFYLAPDGGGAIAKVSASELRDRSQWRIQSDEGQTYVLDPPAGSLRLTTRFGRHLNCFEYALEDDFPDLAQLPHVGTTLEPENRTSCLQTWNLTLVFQADARPPRLAAVVYDQWEW